MRNCNAMAKVLIVSLLLFLSTVMTGQERGDYQNYMEQAGDASLLYRGREAGKYNFAYNGTYYWDHYGFRKGDLLYNGKWYRDVELNVDAYIDEVILRHSVVMIVLNKECIERFSVGDNDFIVLHEDLYGVGSGVYQVVHEGKTLMVKKVRKEFVANNVNAHNGDMIGYDDPHWKSNVFAYFTPIVNYYLVKDGKAVKVRNGYSIARQFPEHKRQVRKYANRMNISPSENYELYCATLLKYAESLDNE